MRERPVLSPYHLGEHLVARLLEGANLSTLPLYDPFAPAVRSTLGARLGLSGTADRVLANALFDRKIGAPRFDGMHAVDCAMILGDQVVAVELKLGETLLRPTEFRERFVAKRPIFTHGGSSIGGSMVALLDWNERRAPNDRPQVSLGVQGMRVRPEWLLVLRQRMWESWVSEPSLAATLGTSQLAGVVVFEELVDHQGIERARTLAVAMAQEGINSWFVARSMTSREHERTSASQMHRRAVGRPGGPNSKEEG